MKLVIALLMASPLCFGFGCISAGTGFWPDPTRWSSCNGSFPGIGDTAQLQAGHTITIPVGVQIIVGTSGANGTVAITCDTSGGPNTCSDGVLIVNGTLTFRGDVAQNGPWVANAGAVIEHDSSAASSPSTTNYNWTIGRQFHPTSHLTFLGSPGNRVTVRNAAGSGRFGGFHEYSVQTQGGGSFDFSYTNISGCGVSTSGVCISNDDQFASFTARCNYCSITDSGYISIGTHGSSIKHTTFTSPNRSDKQYIHWRHLSFLNAISPAEISDTYLDGFLWIAGSGSYPLSSIRNLVIKVTIVNPIQLNGAVLSLTGGVDGITIISTASSTANPAELPGGPYTRLMGLKTSDLNPHFFQTPNGPNSTIDGGFGEVFGGGNDGDFFLATGPGGTTSIKNIITVPTALGVHPGTFINATGSIGSTQYTGEQNTLASQDQGNGTGIGFSGEIAAGTAGEFQLMRDNIGYALANHESYIARYGPSGNPVNGFFNGADYNWKWNFSNSGYFGADALYTSPSPPGTHDTTGDPRFVEVRRFLDWGQRLDPTITNWAGILAKIAAMNDDTGYDPRFNIADAYNWLRAGFRPRNPAVMTAGHAGGRVGAMDLDSKFGPIPNQGQ